MNQEKVVRDDFVNQEINLTSVSEMVPGPLSNVSKKKNNTKNKLVPKLPYFNFDIILSAVAFGCILGVFLFYFQGLQPLILRNYAENSSKKIVQVKEKYVSQITPIIAAQESITLSFENDSSKVCSQQTLYENKLADQEKNDRLKLGLVPDSKLKNLSNSGPFFNSEIQKTYQKFFNEYIEALNFWSTEYSNINSYPNFLEYRNVWITTCQQIEESKGDLALLKEACTNFNKGLSNYESIKSGNFWEQISKGVEESIAKCNEVTSSPSRLKNLSNFGSWKLDWLNGFDRVLAVRPVWGEINVASNKKSENLINNASVTIVKINQIADERQQFINLWYIMEFKAN